MDVEGVLDCLSQNSFPSHKDFSFSTYIQHTQPKHCTGLRMFQVLLYRVPQLRDIVEKIIIMNEKTKAYEGEVTQVIKSADSRVRRVQVQIL